MTAPVDSRKARGLLRTSTRPMFNRRTESAYCTSIHPRDKSCSDLGGAIECLFSLTLAQGLPAQADRAHGPQDAQGRARQILLASSSDTFDTIFLYGGIWRLLTWRAMCARPSLKGRPSPAEPGSIAGVAADFARYAFAGDPGPGGGGGARTAGGGGGGGGTQTPGKSARTPGKSAAGGKTPGGGAQTPGGRD